MRSFLFCIKEFIIHGDEINLNDFKINIEHDIINKKLIDFMIHYLKDTFNKDILISIILNFFREENMF